LYSATWQGTTVNCGPSMCLYGNAVAQPVTMQLII
jgi:hypothetical protein